jgi:hypothetical protein
MGRQESDTSLGDDIDEFFESSLSDDFNEVYETLPSSKKKLSRLVELRRKAEERMEEKRLDAEYGYDNLD